MNWYSLLAAQALRWFSTAYASAAALGQRAAYATQSLFRRFPTAPESLLDRFAQFAEESVRAARRLNQSTRDAYTLPGDAVPDLSPAQRRAGFRGPTSWEIGYTAELVFEDSDGNTRTEWYTDDVVVPLGSNRAEIMDAIERNAMDLPDLFRGDRYRRRGGEVSMSLGNVSFRYVVRRIVE